MRFRSVVPRRRDLLSLLLLPTLLLGGAGVPRATTPLSDTPGEPRLPVDDGESTAYWVFLTPAGWERSSLGEELASMGARLRMRSRYLRAVSVEISGADPDRLLGVPGVRGIRAVARLPVPPLPGSGLGRFPRPVSDKGADAHDTRRALLDGAESLTSFPLSPADSAYGDLGPFLDVLGIPTVHGLGFTGMGVRIGILDGFFLENHGAFRSNPPLAVLDLVDEDGSVSPGVGDPAEASAHGTGLWSLLTGNIPNTILGGAPEAGVLLVRVVEVGTMVHADEDRWVAGLEWLETQGARLVLSGVSFRVFQDSYYAIGDLDGNTTPATLAADEAARRGVLVVAPVGNQGPGIESLEAPADGDSVLAAGAVGLSGTSALFSARGPTADGRTKPDLMAPGEGVPVVVPLSAGLSPASGTEFAGALLTAGAALFVEAYPERGPLEIMTALRGASRPRGEAYEGVPDVASGILFPEGISALPVEEVVAGGIVSNLAPQFRWDAPVLHPLGLPVTFRLEFAEDSLFESIQWVDSVVGTFGRRPSRPLPPRSTLYWRVQGRSSQGVTRNSRRRGPLQVPAWVGLDVLNQPGGTQLTDAQPRFEWTALDLPPPLGPFTFELQVLSDRGGEPIQSYPELEEDHLTLPEPLPFNEPLRWRVIARAREGSADTTTSAGPFVVTSGENPPVTILFQNFPNPFPNPEVEGGSETHIWFDLARESDVELAVFDIRGRLVRSLIPAPGCGPIRLPPGPYGREGGPLPGPCMAFSWDGRDDRGVRLGSGVYLLRLRAGAKEEIRRMVLRR